MSSSAEENMFLFPELVFGLAGAIGTDLGTISDYLSESLNRVQYRSVPIRLIEGIHQFEKWQNLPEEPVDERYQKHMDAGDEFREILNQGSAIALLGVSNIPQERKVQTGTQGEPASKFSYILRSLKRPEEVLTLREIYGKNFILIASYSAHENRKRSLARKIARSRQIEVAEAAKTADNLIKRDQKDIEKTLGQSIRDVFGLADFFLNSDDKRSLRDQINRIVELIFGNTFHTPTPDEHGMFHAWATSLRSASLARQVGAAICSEDGEVIALGCNEVPKAGGGQYWVTDVKDRRDYILGHDSNDLIKNAIIGDLLKRLGKIGWLIETKTSNNESVLVKEVLSELSAQGIGKPEILNITEFGREVHAEMAALMNAVRRGVSLSGKTLFCTTFPCHNCAKHIIAAGIKRVVYVEPYPKSRALELHEDAIRLGPDNCASELICFEPFVGVSPRQYFDLFSIGPISRKEEGAVLEWTPKKTVLRLRTSPLAYMRRERDAILDFEKLVSSVGLNIVESDVNSKKK